MNVFGSAADLYEAARPGYPSALAEAVVAYHGGIPGSVAEIGAGTGKGTEVLAVIGAPMNQRARRALAPAGTLAVFGHRYGYSDARQSEAIRAALDTLDPTAAERPTDWFLHDVLDSGQFTDVEVERFQRDLPLNRDQFLALVRTFGPFLTRPAHLQRRGIEVLGRLVDDFGGTVVLDLRTTLTLGRPAPA